MQKITVSFTLGALTLVLFSSCVEYMTGAYSPARVKVKHASVSLERRAHFAKAQPRVASATPKKRSAAAKPANYTPQAVPAQGDIPEYLLEPLPPAKVAAAPQPKPMTAPPATKKIRASKPAGFTPQAVPAQGAIPEYLLEPVAPQQSAATAPVSQKQPPAQPKPRNNRDYPVMPGQNFRRRGSH